MLDSPLIIAIKCKGDAEYCWLAMETRGLSFTDLEQGPKGAEAPWVRAKARRPLRCGP